MPGRCAGQAIDEPGFGRLPVKERREPGGHQQTVGFVQGRQRALIGERFDQAQDSLAPGRPGQVLFALRHPDQDGLVIAGQFGQAGLGQPGFTGAVLGQKRAEGMFAFGVRVHVSPSLFGVRTY